jgi:hypothetical protein
MQRPSETKPAGPKKPVAIITNTDGARIEAMSIYLHRLDLTSGPLRQAETQIGLPLASGVIVHFDKMKCFELCLIKRAPKQSALPPGMEDWDAEATITLLDGNTMTEKLVYRSHIAELRGGHALGSYALTLANTKRVDLQW